MRLNDISKKLDTALTVIKGSSMVVEVRLSELMKKTDPLVQSRANDYSDKITYRVRLIKQTGQHKFYFTVKGKKKKKYNVNVEFMRNNPDFTLDDVRVSCTCGYFRFFGPDWNAKENGYKLRKMSNSSAPDIRDPNREHWICKHIYAVSKVLMDILKNMPSED